MKISKNSPIGTKRKRIVAVSAVALSVSALGLSTQAQQANQRVERKIEGISRSQTARKAQDSAQTRKAKDTQHLKTAKTPLLNRSGVWNLDPAHSSVGFSIRHVGINQVKGTFNDIEGTITGVEGDLAKSSVSFRPKSFLSTPKSSSAMTIYARPTFLMRRNIQRFLSKAKRWKKSRATRCIASAAI